jgi:hypothetical protein
MSLRPVPWLASLIAAPAFASLIGVSQNSVPALDAVPPQIEATPLSDRSFAFVDRTHELTGATYSPSTLQLLSSQGQAPENYRVLTFPSYLVGAQYVANANDNRGAGTSDLANDYLVTYTVSTPGTAYLLLDNRLNGTGSSWSSSQGTDPDLGGNLGWVLNDGWTRVATGINPTGDPLISGDYVGIDERGSVAGPADRVASGLASGLDVNQFFSVYKRDILAGGTFTTGGIRQATGGGNMYVVAFVAVPEPSSLVLLGVGIPLLLRLRQRSP